MPWKLVNQNYIYDTDDESDDQPTLEKEVGVEEPPKKRKPRKAKTE